MLSHNDVNAIVHGDGVRAAALVDLEPAYTQTCESGTASDIIRIFQKNSMRGMRHTRAYASDITRYVRSSSEPRDDPPPHPPSDLHHTNYACIAINAQRER